MTIRTAFQHRGRLESGELEIQLLPGLPQLNLVGLPDGQIREAGIKIKSAFRACGKKWPRGHQVIVNLRPARVRKSGTGVELAIALGLLAKTGQLAPPILEAVKHNLVYGEVGLDGRVEAPFDIGVLLNNNPDGVLTGVVDHGVREGYWIEMGSLADEDVRVKQRFFDWDQFWQAPEMDNLRISPKAAELLWLSAHLGLHVILAGPQGTGKTTWARLLYALTDRPDTAAFIEREAMVGSQDLRWRPIEQPHHSATALAMVGGGHPIRPGVISRAHGGVLVMNEFLQFAVPVLESLREPLEMGTIELFRKNEKQILPARFQLIATTNLCPCGRLSPTNLDRCPMRYGLARCLSVVRRLSGPLLDRFDVMALSHEWLGGSRTVALSEVREQVQKLRAFALQRGERPIKTPDWVNILGLNHRRKQALLRVARGYADFDESLDVKSEHVHAAHQWVVDPITELNRLYS